MKQITIILVLLTSQYFCSTQSLLEGRNFYSSEKRSPIKDIQPLDTFFIADYISPYFSKERKQEKPETEITKFNSFPLWRNMLIEIFQAEKKTATESIEKTIHSTDSISKTITNNIEKLQLEIKNIVSGIDSTKRKENWLIENFKKQCSISAQQIESGNKKLQKYLFELTKLSGRFESEPSLDTSRITNYKEYKKADSTFRSFDSLTKNLIERIQIENKAISSNATILNQSIKDFNLASETKSDKKKEQNLSVLPALTAKLGKREILPNITLLGSTDFNSTNWYGSIRLYMGAGGNPDKLVTTENLLLQEFSSFGFISNFNYYFFNPSKKQLALNLGVNYLGKNLQASDTSDFNTSVFHFKTGGELEVIEKKLALYINFNWVGIADNLDKFKTNLKLPNKVYSFTDFGTTFKLSLVNSTNTYLDINLGFILNGHDAKQISNSSDPVIPRIKIGITQGIF